MSNKKHTFGNTIQAFAGWIEHEKNIDGIPQKKREEKTFSTWQFRFICAVYSIKANWKEISFATLSAVIMCVYTHMCVFFLLSSTWRRQEYKPHRRERARICRAKREGKKAIKNALCLRKFLTQSTAVVARDMDIYFAHLLNSLFSNISPNTLSSDSSFAAFVVVVAARFFFLSIFFRCFSPVVGVQSIYGSRSFVSLVIPLFGQRFRDFLSTDSFFFIRDINFPSIISRFDLSWCCCWFFFSFISFRSRCPTLGQNHMDYCYYWHTLSTMSDPTVQTLIVLQLFFCFFFTSSEST